MKILGAQQIKAVDQLTIATEPISSINLMERAAMACMMRLVKYVSDESLIYIVCGKGNNGGDGLAIGRQLLSRGFDAKVAVLEYTNAFSSDAETNYNSLKEKFPDKIFSINTAEEFSEKFNDKSAAIVDAILGSGLNKPINGLIGECIEYINENFRKIISIDVPSGLYIDESSANNKHIVRSTITLTFQLPKLSFLLPENEKYIPQFEIINIGLNENAIALQPTHSYFFNAREVAQLLLSRNRFSHKGTFGHALLIAGSANMAGAAIIAAKGCLRSGAGMLTVHSVKAVSTALNYQLPEAMNNTDENENFITSVEVKDKYNAIAIGPGIGTEKETAQVLKAILNFPPEKLLIDADGLNILAENKTWLSFLPADTILTPHPKEFERLTEKASDDFDRLNILRQFAVKHRIIVILKGGFSAIAMPDGNIYFNTSGNPGLAKAGSGDGLTGIILGLLTRGYTPAQAAIIGTFIHGYSADICLKKMSMESLLISDVINCLPKAFKKLEDKLKM